MMRCAQRGCEVPEGTDATGFCPVCNNPLQIILTDEVSHAKLDEAGLPMLADLIPVGEAVELATSDPEGHQQAIADAEAESVAQFESPGGADDPT